MASPVRIRDSIGPVKVVFNGKGSELKQVARASAFIGLIALLDDGIDFLEYAPDHFASTSEMTNAQGPNGFKTNGGKNRPVILVHSGQEKTSSIALALSMCQLIKWNVKRMVILSLIQPTQS
jgi:hypothetical protein